MGALQAWRFCVPGPRSPGLVGALTHCQAGEPRARGPGRIAHMNKELVNNITPAQAVAPNETLEAEIGQVEDQGRASGEASVAALPNQDIFELGAYLRQRTVEAQMGLLLQKTSRKEVRTRLLNPNRPEGPGNPRLKYLEHAYVTETLNVLFGFNWDLEVLEQQRIENEAVVKTRLRVRLADGSVIIKDSFGGSHYQPGNPNASWADSFKAAESDGLKAAAARLGVGLDLYRHEEKSRVAAPSEGKEKPAEPENKGWNWFWGAKVRELGLAREEVHARLGVTSVKDWVSQGKTLEEAVKVLEGK